MEAGLLQQKSRLPQEGRVGWERHREGDGSPEMGLGGEGVSMPEEGPPVILQVQDVFGIQGQGFSDLLRGFLRGAAFFIQRSQLQPGRKVSGIQKDRMLERSDRFLARLQP